MKKCILLLLLLLWLHAAATAVHSPGYKSTHDKHQSTAPCGYLATASNSWPNPLKLVSWNVNLMTSLHAFESILWWFSHQDMNDPELRAEEIADFLVKRNYFIVVLQEILDRHLREIVDKKMSTAGYYSSPVLGSSWYWLLYGRLFNGGVKVYSKKPMLQMREFIFPRPAGGQGWAAMGAWYVTIPSKSHSLHLFGLHLQTIQNQSEEEYKRLVEHYYYLAEIKDSLNIPEHDTVLYIGDFNSDAGRKGEHPSMPDQYFQLLLTLIHAKPAARFIETSLPYSFDANNNAMACGKDLTGTLDNILCDTRHRCPTSGYLNIFRPELPYSDSRSRLGELSDHYPIEGKLRFNVR